MTWHDDAHDMEAMDTMKPERDALTQKGSAQNLAGQVVGPRGLEPRTSPLSGVRSNHLS